MKGRCEVAGNRWFSGVEATASAWAVSLARSPEFFASAARWFFPRALQNRPMFR